MSIAPSPFNISAINLNTEKLDSCLRSCSSVLKDRNRSQLESEKRSTSRNADFINLSQSVIERVPHKIECKIRQEIHLNKPRFKGKRIPKLSLEFPKEFSKT